MAMYAYELRDILNKLIKGKKEKVEVLFFDADKPKHSNCCHIDYVAFNKNNGCLTLMNYNDKDEFEEEKLDDK